MWSERVTEPRDLSPEKSREGARAQSCPNLKEHAKKKKKVRGKRLRKRIVLSTYCGHCKIRKGFDSTEEACFHNVQIATLTSTG